MSLPVDDAMGGERGSGVGQDKLSWPTPDPVSVLSENKDIHADRHKQAQRRGVATIRICERDSKKRLSPAARTASRARRKAAWKAGQGCLTRKSEVKMNKICVIAFTRSVEPEEPSVFYSLLKEQIPKTCPKRFFRYDNRKYPMSAEYLAQFIEYWRTGYVFWETKKPEIYGDTSLGTAQMDTSIRHMFEASLASDAGIVRFLRELSRALHADYALAHLLPADPKARQPVDGTIDDGLARLLRLSLPGVPWAACYGKPYVNLFGRDALLSLPIHKAEEIGPDLIYCQLTDRLTDCVEDPALIDAKREEVYRRLGRDAFYDPQDPKRQGRVPPFEKPRVAREW